MKERTAIVTGGTGALGREVVYRLADSGYKVYVPVLEMAEFTSVFDRSGSEDPESVLRLIFAFECDATDSESVREFVEKVEVIEKSNIGFLVNTVGGIDSPKNVSELEIEEVTKMMSLNFQTAFNFSTSVLPLMKKNSFGRIVSIGALAGLETSPGRLAYSISKQNVINLMNTISEECKDKNIRCNTIVPGIIDTPANRDWGTEEDIKRWVKPSAIAGIIHSLFSDEWGDVRGSIIKVLGSF